MEDKKKVLEEIDPEVFPLHYFVRPSNLYSLVSLYLSIFFDQILDLIWCIPIPTISSSSSDDEDDDDSDMVHSNFFFVLALHSFVRLSPVLILCFHHFGKNLAMTSSNTQNLC